MIFNEFSGFLMYPRTQMDLLKPSDRVERAIDTLAHYHKRTLAPDRLRATELDGIAAELSRNYFFVCVVQFRSLSDPGPYRAPRVDTLQHHQ